MGDEELKLENVFSSAAQNGRGQCTSLVRGFTWKHNAYLFRRANTGKCNEVSEEDAAVLDEGVFTVSMFPSPYIPTRMYVQ